VGRFSEIVKYDEARQATDDNIICRMRIACWILKATNTYSEYVIIVFPLQQWLNERASNVTFIRTLPIFLQLIADKVPNI